MYGDTSVIRRLARSMRDQAADVRVEADHLVAQSDNTHWTGLAADAMRHRTRERASALRRVAGLHEDAADALEHHAAEVDRLKDLIASIERRVRGAIEVARNRLAQLAHSLADGIRRVIPDPVDDLLDRFVPPVHGSMDWLDIELPGPR